MKSSDASSLGNAIKDGGYCLTSVMLSNKLLYDDLRRMLMTGLYKSSTGTHLNVSHNKGGAGWWEGEIQIRVRRLPSL